MNATLQWQIGPTAVLDVFITLVCVSCWTLFGHFLRTYLHTGSRPQGHSAPGGRSLKGEGSAAVRIDRARGPLWPGYVDCPRVSGIGVCLSGDFCVAGHDLGNVAAVQATSLRPSASVF